MALVSLQLVHLPAAMKWRLLFEPQVHGLGLFRAIIYMIRPMPKKDERLPVQNYLPVAQKILTEYRRLR